MTHPNYARFPNREQLGVIGQNILDGVYAYNSVSIKLATGKSAKIIHFFAKHSDVVTILGPSFSDKVDLSHYDKSLKSGGGGAEFFISGEDKAEQWALLSAALSISPTYHSLCSVVCYSRNAKAHFLLKLWRVMGKLS